MVAMIVNDAVSVRIMLALEMLRAAYRHCTETECEAADWLPAPLRGLPTAMRDEVEDTVEAILNGAVAPVRWG